MFYVQLAKHDTGDFLSRLACIAADIAALSGPAHGGANEAVLSMLKEIGDESRIDEFIARARARPEAQGPQAVN